MISYSIALNHYPSRSSTFWNGLSADCAAFLHRRRQRRRVRYGWIADRVEADVSLGRRVSVETLRRV